MLLCLLLLFCDLMSVNFDWSIFFIRKLFEASRHISEKLVGYRQIQQIISINNCFMCSPKK